MSLESLFASCWLLVILIIITVQHFPAIIPSLLFSDIQAAMRNKKIFLLFLPVPLLTLIAIWWRCRRRYYWYKPLPPASTSKTDDVTEELPIASQFVGFVIGRQGNKVKELEKQTSTRIRFREAKDGKVAMVTGQTDNVEKAKEAIVMMIKEKNVKKQVKNVEVVVPSFAIGRLIGKQGQNISAMQKESGARITVDNSRGNGTTRMCTVSGSSEQVARGVSLVQQCVSEAEAAQQRSKLNRKLKGDNIMMKTAQMHTHHKGDRKIECSQQPVHLASCSLPSNGDYFPAFVSNVSSQGGLWIQPVSDLATSLDELSDKMMDTYCNNVTAVVNPSVGDYCAAKFSNDGRWYRAQVISTNSTTAHLLFIDYGDDEWHPINDLKVLLPQFCDTPIQACKCQLGGVAVPDGGWSREAIELIEDVTMCAKWEPVMTKIIKKSDPPLVAIVNTSNNQDIDVATKLNEFMNQLPQQQELVDEVVTVEISPAQFESSNMLNIIDDDMLKLDYQSGSQDNQSEQQGDGDQKVNGSPQLVDETVVMEISAQLESSINPFDEAALKQLDDQASDQNAALKQFDDQTSDQHSKAFIIQQNQDISSDQDVTSAYEVQGVSVTFDSDSDNDDQFTIQVEEDVNETWLRSSDDLTDSVTVTVTTEHMSKHVPNYVSVTPVM